MHDEAMKQRIDYLKNFGFAGETSVVGPGINSKMDEIRSAYGLINLKQVDAAIEARRQVALKYRNALRSVKGISFWDDIPGIKHNYSYFPIFVEEFIENKGCANARNSLSVSLPSRVTPKLLIRHV